ncbi:MAG TPA: hypothetical protein VGN57_07135 [Pirellulaceae bacterium]|nr:hypothetical protein [Pirellulaceae bacterium]
MVDVDASNPFATRFVRPDAATYLTLQTPSIDELVERFDQQGRRAQILGPHGVGKSTLLATVAAELRERGEDVHSITLHLGERRLPAEFEQSLVWNARPIVIVDGAEQLSWLRRRGLISKATKHGAGLLITTHTDLGLPTLCELVPRESDAVAIARHLDPQGIVSDDDVRAAFARRKGDLRETLFDLFDLYRAKTIETRDPGAETASVPRALETPIAGHATEETGRDDAGDRNDFAGR